MRHFLILMMVVTLSACGDQEPTAVPTPRFSVGGGTCYNYYSQAAQAWVDEWHSDDGWISRAYSNGDMTVDDPDWGYYVESDWGVPGGPRRHVFLEADGGGSDYNASFDSHSTGAFDRFGEAAQNGCFDP